MSDNPGLSDVGRVSLRDEIRVVQDGRTSVYKVHLLRPAVENKNNDGLLYYCFLPELRNIVLQSDNWGRLQPQGMVCLSSKYRLALYELIQKRANLKGKMFEDLSLDQLREILEIPKGKLLRIQDFRRRVIEPAIEEVVNLSDCSVKAGPIKTGRTTVGYRCTTGHVRMRQD